MTNTTTTPKKRTAKPKPEPQQHGRTMTDEHKAALALGREEGRAVRAYLEALEATAPKRGRKRSVESIDKRLAVIDQALKDADPLHRLQLVQEAMDLNGEREVLASSSPIDLAKLEADFVAAAPGYSQRKGITRAAWRVVGVSPAVLKRAGL